MAEPTKTLRRLPDQGQIAGVCAGLAEYFNMDATLMRVIFIVLAVITGGGFILVYLVLAVVMPKDPTAEPTKGSDIGHNIQELAAEARDGGKQSKLRNFLGFGLILLGFWLLLGELFPGWYNIRWDFAWPLILILLGIFIATRRMK